MLFVKCMECGSKVSNGAYACTCCGHPIYELGENMIYCSSCGTGVFEGEKKCPECGKEILSSPLDELTIRSREQAQLAVKSGEATKVRLFDMDVIIHHYHIDEYKNCQICNENYKKGEEAKKAIKDAIELCIKNFKEGYTRDKITSVNAFIGYVSNHWQKSGSSMARVFYNKISKAYGEEEQISYEGLLETYFNQLPNTKTYIFCKEFVNTQKEMNAALDMQHELRKLQKQVRPRAIGGGYGIGGMIKGAITAGVVNAAVGGAYDIKNAFADAHARNKFERESKEVFFRRDFTDILFEFVRKDLEVFLSLAESFVKYIEERDEEVLGDSYMESGFMQFTEGFEDKIKKAKSDEEKRKIVYVGFKLCPWLKKIYRFVLEEWGDEKRELDAIASIGNVDIDHLRGEIVSNALEKIPLEIDEDAYKEECKNVSKHFGIFDVEKIDELCDVERRHQRIVENVLSDIDWRSIESIEKGCSQLEKLNFDVKMDIRRCESVINKIKKEEEIREIKNRVNQMTDGNSMQSIEEAIEEIGRIDTFATKELKMKLYWQKESLVRKRPGIEENIFIPNLEIANNIKREKETILSAYEFLLPDFYDFFAFEHAFRKVEDICYSATIEFFDKEKEYGQIKKIKEIAKEKREEYEKRNLDNKSKQQEYKTKQSEVKKEYDNLKSKMKCLDEELAEKRHRTNWTEEWFPVYKLLILPNIIIWILATIFDISFLFFLVILYIGIVVVTLVIAKKLAHIEGKCQEEYYSVKKQLDSLEKELGEIEKKIRELIPITPWDILVVMKDELKNKGYMAPVLDLRKEYTMIPFSKKYICRYDVIKKNFIFSPSNAASSLCEYPEKEGEGVVFSAEEDLAWKVSYSVDKKTMIYQFSDIVPLGGHEANLNEVGKIRSKDTDFWILFSSVNDNA